MGIGGEVIVWAADVEIGVEDGLREGEAGGLEGKCGLAVSGLMGSGPTGGWACVSSWSV